MKELKDKEVAFFGKITAGITHEIKNVLAIIKESSGLMEDIISMSKDVSIPYQEKFQKTLSTIKDQVQRGVELTGKLNRFAHSPDESPSETELNEITDQLIILSARFARLKNIILRNYPSEERITIKTHPLKLQMVLFSCIENCLNVMPLGGEIHIYPQKKEGKIAVHFSCEGDLPGKNDFFHNMKVSEKWSDLQQITDILGGFAKFDESSHGISLFLPDESH
ncbi:MAG: hypothetical protein SV062_09120 [Thermodesulfobacteriota bacterium]|nr:hypothetical protein [Thermodesulfobacteriota bacterium]